MNIFKDYTIAIAIAKKIQTDTKLREKPRLRANKYFGPRAFARGPKRFGFN
jgi:hypothetical protein